MASEIGVAFQIGAGVKGKGLQGGHRFLNQPRGLHVMKDGTVVVADYGNHCVLKFKPNDDKGSLVAGVEGKILPDVDPMKDIDKPGPLALPDEEGLLMKRPVSVCEDSAGGFLVLDVADASVQRFDAGSYGETIVPHGGKAVSRTLASPESIKHPRDFLVAPDGAIIVCDTWSHRLLRFAPPGSPEAGDKPSVLAGKSNSWGPTPDKFAFPSSIALDADGSILVADTNNHRVQRVSADGTTIETVAGSAKGERGSGPADLNMPTGLCVDAADGSLLVTDRFNSRLLRFPRGSRAGTPGAVVADAAMLHRPWGVRCGPRGAIYVSDESHAVVLRLEAGASGTAPLVKKVAPEEGQETTEAEVAPEVAPGQQNLETEQEYTTTISGCTEELD